MPGDERQRHCDRCALQVYNLSAMTRREISDLVSKAEGRVCGRFFRRQDGTLLTRDCPVGWTQRLNRRLSRIAVAAFALLGFLPGCVGRDAESTTGASATPTDGLEVECQAPTVGRMVLPPVEVLGDLELGEIAIPELEPDDR